MPESSACGAGRAGVRSFVARLASLAGPRSRTVLSYLVAGGIIWWVARGIRPAALAGQLAHARAGLFLATAALATAAWFFGEAVLLSRLFTYFHHRTGVREMIVPMGAQYFLQTVNAGLASSALIVFLKRCKGVPWLTGGFTLLFQAFIDFTVMVLMALVGLAAAPVVHPHALGWGLVAVLGALWSVAWFWMRGRPRSAFGQWLYDRPSMRSFRQARLSYFVSLSLIRAIIFAMQGFALYFEMRAFHIHVPLQMALAFTPVILLITSLPLAPVGLGTEQAAMVLCFHAFAPAADLIAMSLAVSVSNILFRMGFGAIYLRPYLRLVGPIEVADAAGSVEETVRPTAEVAA